MGEHGLVWRSPQVYDDLGTLAPIRSRDLLSLLRSRLCRVVRCPAAMVGAALRAMALTIVSATEPLCSGEWSITVSVSFILDGRRGGGTEDEMSFFASLIGGSLLASSSAEIVARAPCISEALSMYALHIFENVGYASCACSFYLGLGSVLIASRRPETSIDRFGC